jgi:hypothetical protein
MGHQHHFLSRLDRVSLPHVELALSLYRDPDLVRHVVRLPHVPADAERVAIALDHDDEGPSVIVTREGTFVTCLGAGMRPTGRPVVTRVQLDGVIARANDLRKRNAARRQLGAAGDIGTLLGRLRRAGEELSREELVALSSLQPFLLQRFVGMLAQIHMELPTAQRTLARIAHRTRIDRPQFVPALQAYWKDAWAAGHLSVLIGLSARELLELLPPEVRSFPNVLMEDTLRTAPTGLFLRVAWTVGKMGKTVLQDQKRIFEDPKSGLISVFCAGLALLVLGLRHKKLRAEVRKTILSSSPVSVGDDSSGRDMAASLTRQGVTIAFDVQDRALEHHLEVGRRILFERGQKLPADSPFRFASESLCPVSLGMLAALDLDGDVHDPESLVGLYTLLPWLATANAEDLYWPQEAGRALRQPWSLQRMTTVLTRMKPIAPVAEGPSRSGPCPCGSGKKHKRCCLVGPP